MSKEPKPTPGKAQTTGEGQLPSLKRIEFLVLLVLAEGESHGYQIVKEISTLTEGRASVLPGNLYAILRRLGKEGLLVEAPPKPAPELADQRRRYYRITPFGKRVLEAEAQLMRALVQAVSDRKLIPDGVPS